MAIAKVSPCKIKALNSFHHTQVTTMVSLNNKTDWTDRPVNTDATAIIWTVYIAKDVLLITYIMTV